MRVKLNRKRDGVGMVLTDIHFKGVLIRNSKDHVYEKLNYNVFQFKNHSRG